MNKKILFSILTFLGLVAGSWGVTEIFVLKPVYEVQMAGISEQIIQMQKNSERSYWLNQRFYWQQEIERLQFECGRNPNDPNTRRSLEEAKQKRDEAIREIQRLSE